METQTVDDVENQLTKITCECGETTELERAGNICVYKCDCGAYFIFGYVMFRT